MYLSNLNDDAGFAVKIGVKTRTVAAWRRGERYPGRGQISKIIAATGGVVTTAGIFGQEGSAA